MSRERIDMRYLTDYGVKWTLEKTCRDILQNFYDSNNYTLDGIEVEKDKSENCVCIRGEIEFEETLVTYIGATTKGEDSESAGGFGEGIKIASLVMPRDFQAAKIEISSKDWIITFVIEGKKLIAYLEKREFLKGNYIKIYSRGNKFNRALQTIYKVMKKSKDLFYHSGNPDFKEGFDLDTNEIKIRVLKNPKKDKGNIYVNGQRLHYKSSKRWNQLPGIVLCLSKMYVSLSRDRGAITEEDLINALMLANHHVERRYPEEFKNIEFLLRIRDKWPQIKYGKTIGTVHIYNDPLAEYISYIRYEGDKYAEEQRYAYYDDTRFYTNPAILKTRLQLFLKRKKMKIISPAFSKISFIKSAEELYEREKKDGGVAKPSDTNKREMIVLLYRGLQLIRKEGDHIEARTGLRKIRIRDKKAKKKEENIAINLQNNMTLFAPEVFERYTYTEALVVYLNKIINEDEIATENVANSLTNNFGIILDIISKEKEGQLMQAYAIRWKELQDTL